LEYSKITPNFKYLKQSHTASKTKKIPPRAAPITIPMDAPFELVLVGMITGTKEKFEFMLAATNNIS
jgi:hypothetical protein